MTAADDDGFVTTEWMVGLALLVLPMLMVVAVLPSWTARHAAAAAAAREGARAAVQADTGTQAEAMARTAVAQVLADRGVEGPPTVQVRVPTAGALPRDGIVRVTVSLPTPGVPIPGVGTVSGPTVSAGHDRALDPVRTR